MVIMGIWHYVHKQRYMFELHNKVSSEYLKDLTANPNISRVPGIGLLYSELMQGIPPIFPHFLSNIPSIHSVLVFVSIKSIPISKVAIEERYLFRQVEPREYRMFRCVVRYGYKDVMEEPKEFEHLLIEHLKEFVRLEHFFLESAPTNQTAPQLLEAASTVEAKETRSRGSGQKLIHVEESLQQYNPPALSGPIHQGIASQSTNSSSRIISGPIQGADEEIQFIQKALVNGVVYLLGETEVVAEPNASVFKKMVVNYAYNFLRRNFRQGDKTMSIPRSRLLRVGMTYEI